MICDARAVGATSEDVVAFRPPMVGSDLREARAVAASAAAVGGGAEESVVASSGESECGGDGRGICGADCWSRAGVVAGTTLPTAIAWTHGRDCGVDSSSRMDASLDGMLLEKPTGVEPPGTTAGGGRSFTTSLEVAGGGASDEAAGAVAGAGEPPGRGHRLGQGSILSPLVSAPSAAGAAAGADDDGGAEHGGAQEAEREADGAGEAAAAAADGGAEAGFGRGGGAIAEGATAGEEQPPREDVEGIPDLVAAAEGEVGEGRSGQRRRALTRLPRGRPPFALACSLGGILIFFYIY